jgi:limonene-1,2-epoxide hydrolase
LFVDAVKTPLKNSGKFLHELFSQTAYTVISGLGMINGVQTVLACAEGFSANLVRLKLNIVLFTGIAAAMIMASLRPLGT